MQEEHLLMISSTLLAGNTLLLANALLVVQRPGSALIALTSVVVGILIWTARAGLQGQASRAPT